MSEAVQHLVILAIVAGALAHLGRGAWQTLRGGKGCGCAKGGCARMMEAERKIRALDRR